MGKNILFLGQSQKRLKKSTTKFSKSNIFLGNACFSILVEHKIIIFDNQRYMTL